MTRVLSTEVARTSIDRMRAIINNGLADQITQLANEGRTLSQPDVWDGALAARFRGDWEATEQALRQTNQQLESLRSAVEQIFNNLMTSASDTACDQVATIGGSSSSGGGCDTTSS